MNLIDEIKNKYDIFEEHGFSVRQYRDDPSNVIRLISDVGINLPSLKITEYSDGIVIREVRHVFKETPEEAMSYLTKNFRKD